MQFEAADDLANVVAMGVDGAQQWGDEMAAATAPARAAVERMEAMPAGPELIAELHATKSLFANTPLAIRRAALWKKADSWLQAQQLEALADASASTTDELQQAVVIDTAKLTNQSEGSVRNQFTLMRRTVANLGDAWVALQAGLITFHHFLALDDVLRYATPATLFARSSAWKSRLMMDEINRRADAMQRAGDDRNLGERQIEALCAALLGADESESSAESTDEAPSTEETSPAAAAAGGAPARRQPKRATALLLITLDTLLGGNKSGWLEGYGAITPDLAREIAASDIEFRRLVLDPLSGKPVDLGKSSYRLSAEMRRYVEAFDRTCRMRGCTAPAHFCDVDHAVEWPEGETSCENCGLLCRRHHGVKTKKLYKLVRDDERNVTFFSPFGFEWDLDAATYEEFLDDDYGEPAVGEDPNPPPEEIPLPPEPPLADYELDVDDLAQRIVDAARHKRVG